MQNTVSKLEWVKPELEQLNVEETLTKPFFQDEGNFQQTGEAIGPGAS